MKKKLFNKIMDDLKKARKERDTEEIKRLIKQAKLVKKYI